ncbi:glycosyltransferase family 2 protein [Pedobacter sandarakinus]|uniref:glycosyltransferase family 2 protein n=1 Tax=Pedobacter sandarakinus TaxID=353156 RepID=UPI002246C4FC|nr:glycosyltransferase [Pedobacter sandarakinus]MCX2574882.1 glycosyltransferase [Pedobacter sandarakinus]
MKAETPYHFPNVTLLITHFNRSESLERLLMELNKLNASFQEIIVSDDCSADNHLQKLRQLSRKFPFTLADTKINKGLGNNINKGQDLVKSKYTLYIQEDFVPKPAFPQKLQEAISIMEEDQKWDLISFYAYFPYPYLKPFKNGFSEKYFPASLLKGNNLKFYFYSDHPHLRRTSFLEKFGRYNETVNSDRTELEMSLSVIQNKGNALFYNDHYSLLEQINSQDEPSTASFRKSWSQRKNPIMSLLKSGYMLYKFFKLNILLRNKKRFSETHPSGIISGT